MTKRGTIGWIIVGIGAYPVSFGGVTESPPTLCHLLIDPSLPGGDVSL